MTLVADTSIWVEYLRRGAHGWAAELDELLQRGEVLMCGPVLAELLAALPSERRSGFWVRWQALPWAELERSSWTSEGNRARGNRLYLSPSVPSRIGERLPVGPASTPIPSVAGIAAGFGVSRFTIDRHPHQDGDRKRPPRARHGGAAVRPRRRGESSAMAVRDQVTINDALEAFLAEQRGRLAAKTLRRYQDVVWLLRECLERYGHSSLSADERRRWEKTFEGGEEDAFCRLFGPEKIPAHIDGFLDWFMVRKVMAGQDLLKASGTVTGKLVRWLAGHGYVDEDVAEDAAERAREASRDLPIADRLATLLHEVADSAPEVDVDVLAEEDWVEDHLAISDVEPGRIWFEGGVGPIAVPRKASDLARPGWSAFVTAARTDGAWRLLEVGFVYP